MQTIATKVNINQDRKLTIQLPDRIPAGEYEVVLVLNNSLPHSVQPSIAAAQAMNCVSLSRQEENLPKN